MQPLQILDPGPICISYSTDAKSAVWTWVQPSPVDLFKADHLYPLDVFIHFNYVIVTIVRWSLISWFHYFIMQPFQILDPGPISSCNLSKFWTQVQFAPVLNQLFSLFHHATSPNFGPRSNFITQPLQILDPGPICTSAKSAGPIIS